MRVSDAWTSLGRKKRYAPDAVKDSQLQRCLTLTDLTLLGVGSTLGMGVYVLAGSVSRQLAGPGVVLSFLVAAVASAIAGICYAEFACRVPRAGSAYVYSYVTVGEFAAFTIGWNLILEYIIGGASVARGMVSYLDGLSNDTLAKYMLETMPLNVPFLAPQPDFVAFAVIVALTALLAYGVKESTLVNNVLTCVNLCVILVVVVAGSFFADVSRWSTPKEDIPPGVAGGDGGFLPYGVEGVMAGAAQCFYGYIGFDAIATTGEEALKPQRNIALAIVISLGVVFVAYFSISVVITLMWPYYDQNLAAPLPSVFHHVGQPAIAWVVTVGAVFALTTALLGSMYPLPRVVYAMASDGLIFESLARVDERTRTPLLATLVSGVVAGLMAMLFDLQQLVEMLSIGTLLAYTIVAVCVLILRFEDPGLVRDSVAGSPRAGVTINDVLNAAKTPSPTWLSSRISKVTIGVLSVATVGVSLILAKSLHSVLGGQFWETSLTAVLVVIILTCLLILTRQPTTTLPLTFRVPLVPVLPALSILINTYLMMKLQDETWVRLMLWMVLGLLMYFTYGARHSVQGKQDGRESGVVDADKTTSSKL